MAVRATAASTFIQSGTGAVSRLMLDKAREVVSVKDFGAVGDGTTDDTAAIQAALDTGKHVFVPGVSSYYKLTAAVTGSDYQRLFGEGEKSQLRQTTANANVISATSKTGFVVENLKVYAVGSFTNYNTGAGVLLTSCSKCRVSGCIVENHRGGGVVLYNTNDSKVWGNWFISSPASAATVDTDAAWDIAAVYSSSRNSIAGNHCVSGQGTGIMVQSIGNTDVCDDNEIFGNIVKDVGVYGIVAYRLDVAGSVRRTIVANNSINGVTGAIQNTTTSTYTYGAGLYFQGAEEFQAIGNNIRNTHSAAVEFATTLAPGAIGVTNLTRGVVSGNKIDTAGYYGIDVGDGNAVGLATGYLVIANNELTGISREAISVRSRGYVNITGNTVDTCGQSAIRINSAAASLYNDVSVTGNSVRNITGVAGIEANWVRGLAVTGNSVNTSSTHGIYAANCEGAEIAANLIRSHASRGIQVASTTTAASVSCNNVIGTGTSTEGIRLDAISIVDDSNRISGCTTAWAGNFAVLRSNGVRSTVAAVNSLAAETDLQTYTLPAGAMSENGDYVEIDAWGSTANNANAKTVKLYWGSQVLLTATLTTSQISPWRITANVMRRASNTQRCVAQLTQGGTTKQYDLTLTDGSQTESGSITIKATGQGTSNSDISQLGMNVTFSRAT